MIDTDLLYSSRSKKDLSQMDVNVLRQPEAPAEHAAAHALGALISRLHRGLRRHARATMPDPALTQSHLEVLRLLKEQPGLRVQEAAASLRLAPNSASTIVQQLVRLGYVARDVDEHDRRVARLSLTEAAHERFDRWRDSRQAALAGALATLETRDSEVIEQALPALARLANALEDPSQ
jgi:DNA-binding MarR family transcriptional regulator